MKYCENYTCQCIFYTINRHFSLVLLLLLFIVLLYRPRIYIVLYYINPCIDIACSSSSVYRVYSSLSVILQCDSQDKSPAGQYLHLKTGGNLIYTIRNWAGGKLPSVSLNSSTELAVVAADGRLFHSQMDLGKKEFR